ncbi:probable DNA-directed RNA polymerase III subunit RPC6 [Contarinia nasturtii]|uniref:probable DNA-directed RNA polymerase III subunit RPC6 n=1 Tax=Contarinia nasturtii TaxID=265458 RepID=UPI0012D3B017|nr:probable DNA-directed RNA polymerase III subunit RPC6 [Contarinia nasturtii]
MESTSSTIDEIGELITKHAQENPEGLSNSDLSELLPNISVQDRVASINRLLQLGHLEILTKNNSLIYRYKDVSKKTNVPKGADNEEKIVYGIIEEADNKGIWIRDIRVKSNLIMTQLNKILKNLESRKLIKAVKSVNASKKKVYMLYNMEPDRTVTGGAWYQDQDFESEFVDILNQQSLRFLQMRLENAKKLSDGPLATKKMACCSVKQVHTFISELGISKVKLDEDDLETILKTVVYDGKAERIPQAEGGSLYRAIESPLSKPGLIQTPCGICPIVKICATRGDVTPISCQYLTDWLE